MRILRRESRRRGHDNEKPSLGRKNFAAGFSTKVDEMSTEPKREAPDVVHLATAYSLYVCVNNNLLSND